MSHEISGVLSARIGPDLTEPIANATVRCYHLPLIEGPPAPVPDSFEILSTEQEQERQHLLFAQTRTDERGAFRLDLDSNSLLRPSPRAYEGNAFSVDVLCREVPGADVDPLSPVQVSLGLVRPDWQPSPDGKQAEWNRTLTPAEWGQVRARFDAWVIAGRVLTVDKGAPMPDVRVTALDSDVVQDDLIGTAVTDRHGVFRIDYTSQSFRGTPVPMVRFETGGPDLYFRIESKDGALLLDEMAAPGGRGERGSATPCEFVELGVQAPLPPVTPPML